MASPSRAEQVADSDRVDVKPGTWIRNRRRTHAWAALAALWSVVFALLLVRPSGVHGVGAHVAVGAFYLGIAALGLVFAARVARAGVWLGRDGIVVRGPFRTRAVALADAGLFAPGLQGGGGNGTPCPMLQRADRRAVGVWALGRRNVWFRYARVCQEIQPLCDELNELVASLR